jgi:phosphinothricin acetyltransferase
VYAGVGEVSVYVGNQFSGKGLGKILLKALVDESEKNNFLDLAGWIFPENIGQLKDSPGRWFSHHRKERAHWANDGKWRDVLLLERRSSVIGV